LEFWLGYAPEPTYGLPVAAGLNVPAGGLAKGLGGGENPPAGGVVKGDVLLKGAVPKPPVPDGAVLQGFGTPGAVE
jgi:hypothetical protein